MLSYKDHTCMRLDSRALRNFGHEHACTDTNQTTTQQINDKLKKNKHTHAQRETEKALAHLNDEYVDTTEKMENRWSTMVQNLHAEYDQKIMKHEDLNKEQTKMLNELRELILPLLLLQPCGTNLGNVGLKKQN